MKKLLLIVILLASVGAFAQSERTTDLGGIVSAEAEVGLGGPFDLSVEEELRFDNNCTQLDRWLNSVGVGYSCLHQRMNIGLNADYIRRHNERGYYENRARLGLQVTYTEDFRRFKFQVRSKAMGTFYDETTGQHRVNPKLYWRNRLKVSYPPVFLMNCKDDPIVNYHNSELLDSALTAQGVNHIYIQYQKGGHGFGASETKGSPECRQWKQAFLDWFKRFKD